MPPGAFMLGKEPVRKRIDWGDDFMA